ncbi:MAG: PAS domain S-box protein, partial [Nitrospirae bacterium]
MKKLFKTYIESLSLKGKIRFIVVSITTVSLVLILFLNGLNEWERSRAELIDNMTTFAKVMGENLLPPLIFKDKDTAKGTMLSLKYNPSIVKCVLFSSEGVFVEYTKEDIKVIQEDILDTEDGAVIRNGYLCIVKPVKDGNVNVGKLMLVSDLRWFYDRLSWNYSFNIFVFILAVGVAYLLSGYLHRIVTAPILKLTEAARYVKETGRYDREIALKSHDEIGTLIDGFNSMLKAVREREAKLEREIDERKNAERRLSEREVAYRTLAENLPGIVYRIVFKPDRKMIFFNDLVESMTGYSEEELSFGSVCKIDPLIVKEDRTRVIEEVATAIERGEPFEVEYRIRHRSGEIHHFHEMGRPIYDEAGNPAYIDGVIFDVTEKVKLQADALRASHLASLGELAAGVAHEINNPINGIINYGEMISMESEEGSFYREIGKRIMNEGERISKIVLSLLSFSRGHRSDKVEVDLREVLEDALNLYGAQLRKDGIVLKVHKPEDLPLIRGNPQQIIQVFLNILSNAR